MGKDPMPGLDVSSGQSRLDNLLQAAGNNPLPPVEEWQPPHCGDIGLKIAADGTWSYQGSPIGRQALVKLFARILRREPDGKHYLVTPVEKVVVHVADAPFLAVELETAGSEAEQVLVFRTNVDDIVRCGPDHPMRFARDPAGGGMKPYILVRGRLEALATRSIYYDLMELAREGEGGAFGIWSGGRFFPLVAGEN